MTHDLIMEQTLEALLNDKGKNNTTVENKTNIPFQTVSLSFTPNSMIQYDIKYFQ